MDEGGAQCEIPQEWTGISLGVEGCMEMSSLFLRPIEVTEAKVKVEKRGS